MKLELGKLQTEWVEFLENNPELQGAGSLGKIKRDEKENLDKKNTGMCCLGAGAYVLNPKLPDGVIEDYFENYGGQTHVKEYLGSSYRKLGLMDGYGTLKNPYVKGSNVYDSLAAMNDGCDSNFKMTWKQIARYIKENPESVFTESK